MVTNLIYSQNMNTLTCFLKDSFSKLLWRLCGMFGAFRHCTQEEKLFSQKKVQAYQQCINVLAWKHQKKLSLLLSNGFPLELGKFYQKSQLSFHLQGFSCLQFMPKYWPPFWPFFMNVKYQFKPSKPLIFPTKPWPATWSFIWSKPFLPLSTKPATRMQSKVMLSHTHLIWTSCYLFCHVVSKFWHFT